MVNYYSSALVSRRVCGFSTVSSKEDFIRAAVIRSLHQSVAGSDYDTEQIIQTVSCD